MHEAIRMLQEVLKDVSDSSSSEMEYFDDNSIIRNTSDDAVTESEGFRLPSKRLQRKRKGSRNSDYETEKTSRDQASGNGTQPLPATAPNLRTKEGYMPSVVLRKKARWTTLNTEILRRGIRTTKVVNTKVGIRIQPTTPADYRQMIQVVRALQLQCNSYQLMEEKPLKVVLRRVTEDITKDELNQDLARHGMHVLSCKRMVVEQTRRSISLVFVQLIKNDQSKEIFLITHI
ncbi:hypothetical protein Trydic_g22567 [Trypoxylus dichotomus]